MAKYIHEEDIHNLRAPRIIVPLLLELLVAKIGSVIDVGCGTGTFLKAFKENGVNKVLGVDGKWVNKELLLQNLSNDEFYAADLEEFDHLSINERFDVAVCVEVAEHLNESTAGHLVNNLVNLSNVILFSAAIPFQGGQNHVNEQWPTYWQSAFEEKGYTVIDALRHKIWNNSDVDFWYKQNIMLVVKDDAVLKQLKAAPIESQFLPLVHPDLYLKKAKQLDAVLKGRLSFFAYFKLLIKGLINLKS